MNKKLTNSVDKVVFRQISVVVRQISDFPINSTTPLNHDSIRQEQLYQFLKKHMDECRVAPPLDGWGGKLGLLHLRLLFLP